MMYWTYAAVSVTTTGQHKHGCVLQFCAFRRGTMQKQKRHILAYLLRIEAISRQYRIQEGCGQPGQQLVHSCRDSFQHRDGTGRRVVAM